MKQRLAAILMAAAVVTCLGADEPAAQGQQTGQEWYRQHKARKDERDADKLRQQVAAAAKQVAALQQQVQKLQAEHNRLTELAAAQRNRATDAMARAAACSEENAQLKRQMARLQDREHLLRDLRLGATTGRFVRRVEQGKGKTLSRTVELRTGDGDKVTGFRMLPVGEAPMNDREGRVCRQVESLVKDGEVTLGWVSQGTVRWITSVEQGPAGVATGNVP